MKNLILPALFILITTVNNPLHAETILISTDASRWYPYTYVEEGEAKGIHIDIVSAALKNLGYEVIFKPFPWKRSLRMAEIGRSNAVVSASYKPERAQYMHYPTDAASSKESRWRITQVGYVVVTPQQSDYEFDGDIATLPHPVRAPLGYSIVEDLRKKGIVVTTASNFTQNMKSLIHSQKGVVITPLLNAKMLSADTRFSAQFKISPKEVAAKSYFMTFSKKNPNVTQQEMGNIWNEIKNLREDKTYMRKLSEQYQLIQ